MAEPFGNEWPVSGHPANVQGPGQLAKYKHGLADAVAQKHVHVTLDLDDGTRVTYADPRRFGFMDLTPLSVTSRFLADLGPEPTGNEFNADYFLAACAGRQSPIKAVLLDQKIVAGLGNICLRGFVSGPHQPTAQGGKSGACQGRSAGTGNSRCAGRGDRGRRLQPARFCR